MFLAVGEMTDRKIEQRDLTRGLLTDGLGTLIGGIFNTFPYTSFSQNVGLVGVTGIKSRWVTAVGGVILVDSRLDSEARCAGHRGAIVCAWRGGHRHVWDGGCDRDSNSGIGRLQNEPQQSVHCRDLHRFRHDSLWSRRPSSAKFPKELEPLLNSGIVLAAVAAVLLNAYFNGAGSHSAGRTGAASAAKASGHT